MSEEAPHYGPQWPSRVIVSLGRAPRVGDWFAECCIEDLQQLTDETLAEVLENYDDIDSGGRFWPTREAAIADLGTPAGSMTEQIAREILGVITGAECIRADGSLHAVIDDIQKYEVLSWVPNDIFSTLDGTFSADELEAIAWWMRNKVNQ